MMAFAHWLDQNLDTLIDNATVRLSQDEALRSEVSEAVGAFYEAFWQSIRQNNIVVLNTILIDWVESRSAPTDDTSTELISVLMTLKQVMWEHIKASNNPFDAVEFLLTSEQLFSEAVVYLSRLESENILVNIRTQLQKAQLRIEQLDKSKSNFIAVAAHELRTPLTLVEGYIGMLSGNAIIRANQDTTILVEGVEGGTKRLREIISDLIDVSLLDLGIMELYFQPIWLRQTLGTMVRNVEKTLAQRKLEIAIEEATIPLQPTYADQDRLMQALQKVVMNAIKYTPDGGIIIIRGRELHGFVDLSVADNGIGIAPDNLSRIFDTFSALGDVALHSSGKTKFKGGGPGLGLPIAKGIIEAHGGTIWAESPGYDEERCPGSTFHIMIPMREAPPDDKMATVIKSEIIAEDEI
ncbi:MAG: HAMP domain-containing histidine kinase [Anaerolineaceae bacterium]|nr:HAMP domain-containing histidine kinase [Anaerolineaceae bacterium]